LVSGFRRVSSVVVAACSLGGCLPSFDGLTGGHGEDLPAPADATNDATNPVVPDASFEAATISVTDAASTVVDGTEMFDDGAIVGTVDLADASGDGSDAELDAGCAGGCPGRSYCQGSTCVYASCKDLKASLPSSHSGVYLIDPDLSGTSPPFPAFCGMGISDGGWTLLMKVDGNAKTFVRDSPLWENDETYQPSAAGFDLTEAKLASYSLLPFANLLIGFHVGTTTHFALLAIGGSSLRDLMASGYHPSALGRAGWETIAEGSLQTNCNSEGVNVNTPMASVRLGILANENNDCNTCDSFIGFGGFYQGKDSFACGNLALYSPDKGDRATPLFGYIFAR
jgi:hypothetical protein